MAKEQGEAFYNRSLERALQILNCFSTEKQSLTLSQISEILNLSRATILRLCSTLIKYRFLKQDVSSKQYSLGIRIFELGTIVFHSFSLRRIASPHLSKLQMKLGTTVFLGILDNDELLFIDKKDDPMNPITFSAKIGTRRPPHWGMLGPAILAYLPENDVEKLLQKFPVKAAAKNSLRKNEEFLKWLKQIKQQGYVFDDQTAMDGISGISAPIFDLSGKAIGAIGAAFISSSVNSKSLKKIIKEAINAAQNISRDMGYFETSELPAQIKF